MKVLHWIVLLCLRKSASQLKLKKKMEKVEVISFLISDVRSGLCFIKNLVHVYNYHVICCPLVAAAGRCLLTTAVWSSSSHTIQLRTEKWLKGPLGKLCNVTDSPSALQWCDFRMLASASSRKWSLRFLSCCSKAIRKASATIIASSLLDLWASSWR